SSDSVAGLSIIGRVDVAFISAHAAFEQHVLERDPVRLQKLTENLERLTATTIGLLKEYESTIFSSRDRQLLDAIKAAMGPYNSAKNQALRQSADVKLNNAARSTLLQSVEPLYE